MTPDPTPPRGAAELAGSDWTWLRTYHTNIRHGDNAADCGDCRVGKCDVPDLVDDWERLRARVAALEAACRQATVAMSLRYGHDGDAKAGYQDVDGRYSGGMAGAYWDLRAALAAPAAPPAPESTGKGD